MTETVKASFNQTIIKILTGLHESLDISPMRFEGDSVSLMSGSTKVATITPLDILLGQSSYQKELANPNHKSEAVISNSFFNHIAGKLVRLNHIGISYFTEDINGEVQRLKKAAKQLGAGAYEEISQDPWWRWFFIGNKENWENALFEIVLNKGKPDKDDFWRPHFQIDIDTTMTFEEIKEATELYIDEGFIKWQLDFPDYGTVLGMGRMGEIAGAKIVLGIGTSLRITENHRKFGMQPIQ